MYDEFRRAFQMPSAMSVKGRSSSITAAFVTSIIPRKEPSEDEIAKALDILEMKPNDVRCAYCGDPTTEWDHFHALVKNLMPTGYISEIKNLVPSCGKCNQSKGNVYWKDWISSDAKKSPKSRGILGLEYKIQILEKYEAWGNLIPIDIRLIVGIDLWDQHWVNRDKLLEAMNSAQYHADKLRKVVDQSLSNH